MAASMYSRAISRRRDPSTQRRWSRDLRAPSLRLPPAPLLAPEMTAQLPVITPRTIPESDSSQRPQADHVDEEMFPQRTQQFITLRQIQPRETMPFMGRETACPYLECRSANRRCLSADPAPVSLERQVRHCFNEGHRQCRYYRKARGLPAVPPNQAAFYTAAAVLLLVIVTFASL